MRLTLSHSCCRARLDVDVAGQTPRERPLDEAPRVEQSTTPCGEAAAAEAFGWMNRQLTWQALLADLEAVSWLAKCAPDG
jgi:hypothetical protein